MLCDLTIYLGCDCLRVVKILVKLCKLAGDILLVVFFCKQVGKKEIADSVKRIREANITLILVK